MDGSNDLKEAVTKARPKAALLLVAAFFGLSAVIVHLEIDRLISGFASAGRSQPLGAVTGPLALAQIEGVTQTWPKSYAPPTIGELIVAALIADLALTAVYVTGLWIAIRYCARAKRLGAMLLAIVILAELLEIALLSTVASNLRYDTEVSAATAHTLGWTSTVKWAAIALLCILLLNGRMRSIRSWFGDVARGVWAHRLSAFLVAVLFVLACLPFDEIFDQLPDIQRQWLTSEDGNRHAMWACGVLGGAYVAAFLFGRIRSKAPIDALRDENGNLPNESTVFQFTVSPQSTSEATVGTTTAIKIYPRLSARKPNGWRSLTWIDLWWLAPLLAILLAAVLSFVVSGAAPTFHVTTLLAFIGVPVLAVVASVLISSRPFESTPETNAQEQDSDTARRQRLWRRCVNTWLAGDVIAALVLSVAGLGLVRSVAAPLVMSTTPTLADLAKSDPWNAPSHLFIAGAILATLSPLLILRRREQGRFDLLDPTARYLDTALLRHNVRLAAVCAIAVAAMTLLAIYPIDAAKEIGPVALTILAITLWGVILGTFTMALQDFPPLSVFVSLRLKATPVLTLAVLLPLVIGVGTAAMGVDDDQLHQARRSVVVREELARPQSSASDFRDDLATRISEIASVNCIIEIDGVRVRPVLVVAAEGGGIRAAYWTARALELLERNGECLAESVLLSSGVSGGSLGLAVTAAGHLHAAEQNGTETLSATSYVKSIASPEGVGAAIAGLMVRDHIAATSGLRVPSFVDGKDAALGNDRAALIEHTWLVDSKPLELLPYGEISTPIGIPILNSTDARTKCKVLLTPMEAPLPITATSSGERVGCSNADGWPTALQVNQSCFAKMDWAGMAMLSARFPFVTPSGRFNGPECGNQDLQLVDGGYAEGTGLGTVADLAPFITAEISASNRKSASACEPPPPLVPIAVYLKNSAGYDLLDDLASVSAEPLVPLVGYFAAGKQGTEAALIQRIASSFRSTAVGTLERGSLDTVSSAFPGMSVTVAPSTTPAVAPPLGWSLSTYTIRSLDRAVEANFNTKSVGGKTNTGAMLDLIGALVPEGER